MLRRLLRVVPVTAALLAGRLEAQVSPGPLANAHRNLEGTLKCTQCHGPGKDAMPARCTACHADIGWLATQGRGYHGSGPVKAASCASCHPDHAGADFRLIKWPEGSAARFDHRRAGWALEQSHAAVDCAACHRADRRVSPAAARAPGGRSTWTGLESGCASCHADPHRGALGTACTACHDAGTWTRTPGFRHDTTAYALTGKHAAVACGACHASPRLPLRRTAGGEVIPIYRPVPFQSCASCHRDPHAGGFGAGCTACHTTAGFGEVSAGTGFDHGVTRFPLSGRHTAVRCAGCHTDFTSATGRRPPSATCADCHKPDPHGGTATLAGRAVDCGVCHSERGFTPGTLTAQQHAATRFPLEGKHAAVRCGACHAADTSTAAARRTAHVVMRPGFATCAGCHADRHGGQFANRPGRGECAECHGPGGWAPSTFGRQAHASSGLALEGRHGEIPCQACHAATRRGLRALPPRPAGAADFVVAGIEQTCAGCHLDPHGGRFEPGRCAACHTAERFAPSSVTVASHAAFAFPLAGAHRAVPCMACHGELAARPSAGGMLLLGGSTPRVSRFETPTGCADCHRAASPHGDQFDRRSYRGTCGACHDAAGFKPATRFDHDSLTNFRLEGGHRAVACQRCHVQGSGAAGGAIVYRIERTRCEDCHAGRP